VVEDSHIEGFMALFRANERSYGVYMPHAKTKMMTVSAAYNAEHVRGHLEGEQGLGAVPIMDDNKCWFGVLDIDVHGPNGVHVDLVAIEEKVRKAELPLIVCRSKSGGRTLLPVPEGSHGRRLRQDGTGPVGWNAGVCRL
jgi:hypothetical protein